MTITRETWKKYIKNLSSISEKAKELILKYIDTHEVETQDGRDNLIRYAYGIATKYGEAAAAYACQMYDAMGELEGDNLEPAEPAETASYSEVAKTVNGTIKVSNIVCATAIYRLVKKAGQQTTLNNAVRDHLYYAWIPSGDTCAYCLLKAAGGWQLANKYIEADHIHGNCDCAYATKKKPTTNIGGYEPNAYKKMYKAADGDTMKDKLNALRRAAYAKNKTKTDDLNADWLEMIEV